MNKLQNKNHARVVAIVVAITLLFTEVMVSGATAKPDSKEDIVKSRMTRTVETEASFTFPAAKTTGRLDAGVVSRAWRPGDAISFVPKRTQQAAVLGDPINPTTWKIDPLLNLNNTAQRGGLGFDTPLLNFPGNSFTGAFPPDTNGDVGPTRYIQMVNDAVGGSHVSGWDKTGSLQFGPIVLATTLGTGVCAESLGDPIVLYDEAADRWILSEFSAITNTLCVYVSQTFDPGGTYFSYQISTPNFPDYPKYAVWPDAYLVTSNEPGPSPFYLLDRAAMLTGAPISVQRGTVAEFPAFGFQAVTPVDLDGAEPSPGTPAYLIRHRDDEIHNPGSNDPTRDFLELYELTVDFVGTSTIFGPFNIPISEFDSELCGLFSFTCFEQPNGQQLDPLREMVMWRASFRSFETHQSIVGNLVTDINDNDVGGVRWFELINTGTGWRLRQDGTIGSADRNRWMGSVAMDGSGNIAMGYTTVSTTLPTDMVYSGRLDNAPTSSLSSTDNTIVAGGGSQTNERWGDYSSMSVDPSDDCTFWYTSEYVPPSTQWETRIASFRFSDCGGPPQFCGNALTDGVEECDDGNTIDGDGCSSTCILETLLAECQSENFDNGIGAGFTTFNTGVLPLDWGTTDDGLCFSLNLGPPPAPNLTGGAGEAACIDSDQAGNGVVEAYLCGSVVVPNGPQVTLDFDYNYQLFDLTSEDDFSILVGTIAPSPASISTYTTEFSVSSNQGGFNALPGVHQSVDLSAYAGQGIHYCVRYSGDFDWYAQVDNLTFSAENGCAAPAPEITIEKLTNGVDADNAASGDAPVIAPNDLVSWDFIVTNTGNVTLTAIAISDDQLGGVICTESALDPGQSASCNSSQNAEDLSTTTFHTVAGVCDGVPNSTLYENVGSVFAITSGGMPVEDTDVSHYCNPPAGDFDNDGVADNLDNCRLHPNPGQVDADTDGIGNACDPDYDQNCVVNFLDLFAFSEAFTMMNPIIDLDGNGIVNFLDFSIFVSFVGGPPGPSGTANICP